MRNIVDIINQMIDLIPTNRMTYDLVQELVKIRDRASFMPPEIIDQAWFQLHRSLVHIFKPEEFQLQDWEQQVMNLLIGV